MSNVYPILGRRRGGGFAAGQMFVERYRLVKRIGRGGMGEVWVAADAKIDREVALKLLHPGLLRTEEARERFAREARALCRLEHPYVVPLYDWGTEPQPFIVMKRIEGITLREMLRREGLLPWVPAVCFAVQVAEGLWAIHRMKVWHRDVKPENIMVDEEGHVTILDLGIAREAEGARPGEPTDRIGTLGYLPPEMVLRQPTDHRGDLYQLGVVLYELLTGRKPYSGIDEASETEVQAAHVYFAPDPIQAQVPDCPEALETLVLRLLAKDPAARYQNGRELAADLGRILRERGSVPSGHALEPMVQRALVRRKLNSLAAEREARAAEREALAAQQGEAEQGEAEQGEQAEEDEAPRVGQAQTEPMEGRPARPVRQEHTAPMEAPRARQEHTDPMEAPRATIELGAGFVAQSPASPSARPPGATKTEPVGGEAASSPRPTVSLLPGYVPPMRAPFPLARPEARPASPVRTASMPRARVPEMRAPFPLAKPRRDRPRGPSVGGMTVLALLVVTALVLVARALGVRAVVSAVPVVSAGPVVSAAPVVVSVSVPALPPSATASPAPSVSATASAAPSVSAPSPAATSAPARSAAPVRTQSVKKQPPKLIF